jgi:hypothetical protein
LILGVDATDVYFTLGLGSPNSQSVVRIPRDGGTTTNVTKSCISMAVDATAAYCRTNDALVRIPKNGEAPTKLADLVGQNTLFDGHQVVLVGSKLYLDGPDPTKLLVVPVDGGPTESLDLGPAKSQGDLTAYDGAIYSIDHDSKVLKRVPVDGSEPSTITLPTVAAGSAPVVDASGIYWIAYRSTCLIERHFPYSDYYIPSPSCEQELRETLILRLIAF